MKQTRQHSTLVSHNVTIDGRRTSIRLEPDMWDALKEICSLENVTIHEFCSRVNEHREQSALTAAIRVAILAYYRDKLGEIMGRSQTTEPAPADQPSPAEVPNDPLADPKRNGAPMQAGAKTMR